MQAELLELNAAEVVDNRGVPFHFLQFKFHLGLCNHLLLVRAHNPRFLPESPGAAAPARPDTEPKVIDWARLGGNHVDHADECLHAVEFTANVFAKNAAPQVRHRMAFSFILALDQTTGDEHQQRDAQHDPVNGKGSETAGAHTAY